MEAQVTVTYAEEKEDKATKESKILRENFQIFGVATFLYACFYAFCMYKNDAGITCPLFVEAGLMYANYCRKHLELSVKKGTFFYAVCMLLLGISTFCTDDARIILFNKTGIFLLMVSMVLFNIFETKSWGLGKYMAAILQSILWSWGEWIYPFRDGLSYCKNKLGSKGKLILYAGISVLVSLPVFLLVLNLLMSADAVFGSMTNRLLDNMNFDNIAGILFSMAIMFFGAYGLLSYMAKREIREETAAGKKGEPILAIPMAGILTSLYLVFSVVQIAGLFLGKLELPVGYTYAAYAREGFFQLLAVSILNLGLVLSGMCFFKKSKVLNALLTLMSLCTFIMIASSAVRMVLYIRMYHLTFLRIFVLWSLLVLTVLFIGVILNLYRMQFSLFRYSVVVVTICYLALSFAHPDYWIARYNVAQMEAEVAPDYDYLKSLSADAAPVLVPYFTEKEAEHLWSVENADTMRKFNVSRYIAKQLLENK